MMAQPASKSVRYLEFQNQSWREHHAPIIGEAPVSLTVNGEVWLSFMCSPTDLDDLAVGFLFNERLIEGMAEIADVRVCPALDNVDVWTSQPVAKPENWRRTSGCTGGYTSVEHPEPEANGTGTYPSIEHPEPGAAFVERLPDPAIDLNGWRLAPEQLSSLVGEMFKSQELYRQAGGVHSSMITDAQGLIVTAEDIGRHNTLDKLAGKLLREDIALERRIILTTGRISSEMMQKSARLGAAYVISRTSPTSLSIQLAQAWGITLVGYARRDQFRVYSHPENLAGYEK